MAVLTLAILAYTFIQGVAQKTDKQTNLAAVRIAKELNEYIDQNNRIPESLAAADITDVPSAITYERKTSEVYEFCTTYKQSKGYGSADFTSAVVRGLYGIPAASSSEDDYYSSSKYYPSQLYVDLYYQKGENCQSVKPYITDYTYPRTMYNDLKELDDSYLQN